MNRHFQCEIVNIWHIKKKRITCHLLLSFQVNSVWFKLYMYNLTGCGPASLLLVKGTKLRRLPKIFLEYDRLLVTTWGHDPGVIATSNILLTLNDALSHSAVFVQVNLLLWPYPTCRLICSWWLLMNKCGNRSESEQFLLLPQCLWLFNFYSCRFPISFVNDFKEVSLRFVECGK